MNSQSDALKPLGDFLPTDIWQTHVNSIFYGTLGSNIHNHFQTYVSRDYRLANALAEDFFKRTEKLSGLGTIFIQEWGVGNGNLAACFLNHIKKIDFRNSVYPRIRYILCDYSLEILRAVRSNPRLKEHEGLFFTIQVDAESLNCFKYESIHKIISNEIWDDLSGKVIVKEDGQLLEEYIQPSLRSLEAKGDFDVFAKAFSAKDFTSLRKLSSLFEKIFWQRAYQRVDLSDWPYYHLIETHAELLPENVPIPINTGAFYALEKALKLLAKTNLGYSGMDYGMLTLSDLAEPNRPYYSLYGGQYTLMVNFPLLTDVANAIGFRVIQVEPQHHFVGKLMGQGVLSLLELVQSHPKSANMENWERDILLLETLHALNDVYKSPFRNKMEYPSMPGTPKKFRKKIDQLVKVLNPFGVPDTVAYLTHGEVISSSHKLSKLGYQEKHLQIAFKAHQQPVSFIYSRFDK